MKQQTGSITTDTTLEAAAIGGARAMVVPVLLLVFCFQLIANHEAVYAATEAGTIIKNQASASYRDTRGVKRIATSNVVETIIRQVAAVELTLSQKIPGVAGQEILFSHTLVNTGNGADQFDLMAALAGGNFNLTELKVYPDTNRDGQPDSYVAINVSPALQADESWSFVVAGNIPFSAQDNELGVVAVTVTSVFDNNVAQTNTDQAIVTDTAVVQINKQISELRGNSPDGPFTVRIQYKNSSDVAATDVSLIDALPAGMAYVAGSGRWSETASVVLTDSNPNDSQSGVRYCAYDSSCTGLVEANSDDDSDSTNQVTVIVDSIAAGETGYVEFDVSIVANLASAVLFNTAELQYTTAGEQVGRINSNAVPFTIIAGAGVVINGSLTTSLDGSGEPLEKIDSVFGAGSNLPVCQSAGSDPDGDGYGWENSAQCIVEDIQAGNSVFYSNTVWNIGTDTDTFDITTALSSFPENTVFRLLKADGQTPLLDTSGNGVPDTGPIAAGASQEIVLQIVLPDAMGGDNGGVPFGVTTVATSVMDSTASNTMLNLLQNITGASVDITNNEELGSPAALGIGHGPETVAVTTLAVVPGGSVDIDLVVNNVSAFPMEYNLTASIFSDFSSIELPDQWQLEFRLSDGTVVSGTGVIPSGQFVNVTARVTVPLQVTASITSLYFRADNERYAVADIKHDAIEITAVQSLLLGIDQEGQTEPGGTSLYHHTLANAGNTAVNNISLTVTDSKASEGWSSVLYEDTDSNGVLGSADQIIDSTTLMAGESKTLFLKIFAPGTAASGSSNSTELVASAGVEVLSVTDITNVSSGNITVLKEQALDSFCDGVLDSSYSVNGFSVEPGNNCVRYRLTAFNSGSESVLNVVVADATPTFTSYAGSAVCSQPGCTVSEPVIGSDGEITASLAALPAGDSVVVEFMVRID